MPVPFSIVCQLLDQCERLCSAGNSNSKVVADWFARHRDCVDAHDTDLSALLSTLLPEKRTDRVYCIQTASLEKMVARALLLGSSRVAQLGSYRQPGLGLDLADCVERILKDTPNPVRSDLNKVTVEELDALLHGLASGVRWSSPAIRCSQTTGPKSDRSDIELIYRRLEPTEAKWFTRLVLKNLQPVILDSSVVIGCCHPLLPAMLNIQDDFGAAIRMLRYIKGNTALTNLADRTKLLSLKPQVGVKVGRQNWIKARSIKHCFNLGHGRMSIERKIDGEYCQIHIDATTRTPRLQIFSKSGKDSTEDRKGLRGAIYESLQIGRPGCNFRSKCILEGELVVYSHREKKILPFHRIRNHVTRRGMFLNTEADSRPDASEELMIIYFDILLLDDRSLLHVRRCERFKLLQQTVHPIIGRAELVSRQLVDFDHAYAASDLRKAFAQVIVERGEGLVLKPDEPYFNFFRRDLPFPGLCIKLKKEYIGNLGEVGDFAVVGAGFDGSKAKAYNMPDLQWTHFYLGCLENKEQVLRWNATPAFVVVAVVQLNASQLKTVRSFGFPSPVPVEDNEATRLKVPKGIETGPPLLVAFENPLVFDMRCFSFDRPGNAGFWTLRFPVVSKIHFDRDFRDTVSFDEMQAIANSATTSPEVEDSQENLEWIARLESADPRRIPIDAATQLTASTELTPSPAKSTQMTSQRVYDDDAHSGPGGSDDEAVLCGESPRASTRSSASVLRQGTTLLGGCAQKRAASLSDIASPTRKRRRSQETQAALDVSAPKCDEPRKPLLALSGNILVSHNEILPEPGKSEHGRAAEEKAAGSVMTTVEAWRAKYLVSLDGESAKGGARGSGGEKAGCKSDTATRCSYANAKCQLASFTILVSSKSLMNKVEPAALLKAHGVLGAVTTADRWLRAELKSRAATKTSSAAKKQETKKESRKMAKMMLLVDSIGKGAAETKALVARIEKMQDRQPRRHRNWIAVYDWRVLRNISTLEDETRSKKYYDGFSDPWRRWQCGYC
ncbi:hypothetical protein XA68_13578 [Ophiocordyceps unilateralis]|uniref:ATP-dependent DNA ligase family profile domain-containing protein n=1 Tax=Ophiocordyceps unilateralis TaxID=268505 RepID=A0A2A9PBD2_OPHUN|nr:hypothetical protein XA68_13578 [Ophiocordyceps unilateralis]